MPGMWGGNPAAAAKRGPWMRDVHRLREGGGMPITLIVEDGTMPDGANTYADMATVDAYYAGRGKAAWAGKSEDERAAAIIRAADVLNSYQWKGVSTVPGRIMAWPRAGAAYADGTAVSESIVPVQVVQAQCELAGGILLNGADPLAAVDKSKGAVTSEKVDTLAVTYADPQTSAYTGATGFPFVDGLLKPFLGNNSGRFSIVEVGRG